MLVAGEHLREVVGDERCYGDPVVQKSIALFKKIPAEATYEDLTEQAGPMDEDLEDELEDFVMDIHGGDSLPTTPPPQCTCRCFEACRGWGLVQRCFREPSFSH